MVFIMKFHIDGGCRGNGQPGAIGAAVAVMTYRNGGSRSWTRRLPDYPPPTNQRAELAAVILALEVALNKYRNLDGNPWIDVTICTDSKYVVGCMTDWVYKWSSNGWRNAAGNPVANKDLIQEASALDDRLKEEGDVSYVWIPREQNAEADEYCNHEMDQEERENRGWSSSSDGYVY